MYLPRPMSVAVPTAVRVRSAMVPTPVKGPKNDAAFTIGGDGADNPVARRLPFPP